VQPITSLKNPKVKFLRSLRMRKYRQRENFFLIEGIRIVEEALTCGAPVETLVYAPELLVSERAKAIVDQVGQPRRLALSGDVFRTLSERNEPQGIAALIRIEDRSLAAISLSDDMLVVVAYQLRDPGNLGSIIRTADAVGATGVIVVEPSVDIHDPHTVRATMGSLFALPIVRLANNAALASWVAEVRAAGVPLFVVASSAHGQQAHFDVDYDRPLALLVGSESHGLPATVHAEADALVRLPMAGRATSLNASAAAAALIYEIIRQRRDVGRASATEPF
jgi:TrmH family RNA methyltransferase